MAAKRAEPDTAHASAPAWAAEQVLPKRALIRIVRRAEGVRVDPTGKAPGRGAYLHDRRSCWEAGLHGALARALRTELSDADRQALTAAMHGLAGRWAGGVNRATTFVGRAAERIPALTARRPLARRPPRMDREVGMSDNGDKVLEIPANSDGARPG